MSDHEFITSTDGAFSQGLLRQAFACFPSGVTAFCGIVDDRPEGMAASSFTSVSIDPALVSVCVAKTSSTWPRLSRLPSLGLSVLSAEHGTVARALSAKGIDRFASVEWAKTESGAVFVHGATLWLEATPYKVVDAGDHQIVVLEIDSLLMAPDIEPMIFHRSSFHAIARSA